MPEDIELQQRQYRPGQISLPGLVQQTPTGIPSVVPSSIPVSGNVPHVAQPKSLMQRYSASAQLPDAHSDIFFTQDPNDPYIVREQCRQLCLSVFFREYAPARSLGFTSSVNGEGKSFLAKVAAEAFAKDSINPIVLLECNWENPNFHKHFGFSQAPGLAEWIRGECNGGAIRYQVNRNLTVIPAGEGRQDAVQLLQYVRQVNLPQMLGHPNELIIVDLPAVISTAYGALAASVVDTVVMVVRAGVTPDALVAEACMKLNNTHIEGVVLNQLESKVPKWIRRLF